MLELKYGKRRVINYRGARRVVGGLTTRNKIDILLYITRELAQSRNEEELYDQIIRICTDVFEPGNITLRLWKHDTERLVPVRILKETNPPRRPLQTGEGFSGRVFELGESAVIKDLSRRPDLVDRFETTLSVACAPIRSKSDILGTISLEKDTAYFYKTDDLEILEAMATQVGLALNEVRLVQGLVDIQDRLQSDLKMGRSVQHEIIGRSVTGWNGVHLGYHYMPMVEVSGDYFGVVNRGGTMTAMIADVAGHGVPAALVTMSIHFHFHRCMLSGLGPSETIAALSEALRPTLPDGTYFTAQIVRIFADHSYVFASAGHVELLHYHAAEAKLESRDSSGFPLGFLEVRAEQYQERAGVLQPGDALLMMTDGYAEQRNPDHKQLGTEALNRWIVEEFANQAGAADAQALCNSVLHRWTNHCAGMSQEDDLSMIVMQLSRNVQLGLQKQKEAKAASAAGRLAQALELAMQGYRLEPSLAENQQLIARLLYREGKLKEAAGFLEEYLETSGEEALTHRYELGYMLFKLGDLNGARRELERALAADHTHPEAALMLAKCMLKQRRGEEALQTVDRALRFHPEHPLLLLARERLARFAKPERGS